MKVFYNCEFKIEGGILNARGSKETPRFEVFQKQIGRISENWNSEHWYIDLYEVITSSPQ